MNSNVNVSIFIWKAKFHFLSNCFNISPSAGPGSASSNIFSFFLCAPAIGRTACYLGRTVKNMNSFKQLCGQRCEMGHKSPKEARVSYCWSTKSCKKQHVVEQPQGGTNSTQRIWSVTSSNKTGRTNSHKMHKLLLQSNMLSILEFHDDLTSNCQKYFQKIDFCLRIPVCWKWNVFQKCASSNKSAKKTSVVLCLFSWLTHPAAQVLPEGQPYSPDPQGLLNFRLFVSQTRYPHFYLRELVLISSEGSLFFPVLFSYCLEPESPGWAPGPPEAIIQKELWRKKLQLSASSGLGLVASCGPGCTITVAWGINYPASTTAICPFIMVLEHHGIGQKYPHFESVDLKNLQKEISLLFCLFRNIKLQHFWKK